MAAVNLHSASPLSKSSNSSQEALHDANTKSATMPQHAHAAITEVVPLMLDSETQSTTASTVGISPQATEANLEQQTRSARRTSRAVPRLNTTTELPWKVDETGSPCTPTSHHRKSSYAPPPRAAYHINIDGSNNNSRLSPLRPSASSPSRYTAYQSPPLYSQPSSSGDRTTDSESSSGSYTIDLSHPPGYSQDARASFSDNAYSHTPSPPHSYSTMHSPFYQNNITTSAYPSTYSDYSSSVSSPLTPTRRGRGILDNDPALYLNGEEPGDGEGWYDAAARWAKTASKRLSAGEQGLWRVLEGLGGEDGA